MKVDKVKNDRINFGWNYAHHGELTQKALEFVPALNKFKSEIIESVKLPDFDDIGFFTNNHFFYPSSKGHWRKSFFDFSGSLNAKGAFLKNWEKANKFRLKGEDSRAAEYIGRALHFLQDAAVPMHTQKGSIVKKIAEQHNHLAYEIKALFSNKTQVRYFKPNVIENSSIQASPIDIFMDNAIFSSQIKTLDLDDVSTWGESTKSCIIKTLNSSVDFLNIASKLFKID